MNRQPLKKAPANDSELRDLALRMLARRALTRRELAERLKRRGVEGGRARAAAEAMTAEGYLDETAIAEDHIRRGRADKLQGRFLLKYELAQRGVEEGLVERKMMEMYPIDEEVQVAEEFARRKRRSLGDLEPERLKQRLGAALDRRGFAADVIGRVLRKVCEGEGLRAEG